MESENLFRKVPKAQRVNVLRKMLNADRNLNLIKSDLGDGFKIDLVHYNSDKLIEIIVFIKNSISPYYDDVASIIFSISDLNTKDLKQIVFIDSGPRNESIFKNLNHIINNDFPNTNFEYIDI